MNFTIYFGNLKQLKLNILQKKTISAFYTWQNGGIIRFFVK